MRFIIIIIIFGVKMLSHVWLFATPWTAACQVSLSFTISRSLLKLMYLSWWCLPTISPSAVPFSSCPQSFPASGSFPMSQLFASGGQRTGASASVLPMNQWILISFTINWFDLLAFQGSLKSLLQHHGSKAPSFWCLGSLMVQLWHLCMTSGETIALTIQTTEQVTTE